MHSHTPQDRRAFESPELDAPARSRGHGGRTDRMRSAALPMLFAALVLAAIIALIILL